jgi:hypothetical protein
MGIGAVDDSASVRLNTNCIGDCRDCPYFLRFDICAPEYSTYVLDLHIDMAFGETAGCYFP